MVKKTNRLKDPNSSFSKIENSTINKSGNFVK